MSGKHFMLVHGAWHGAWCWEMLAPLLRDAGHEVAVPDLPGQHDGSATSGRVSLNTYASAITPLLDASPAPLVLVGHSMAGMVISAAAARAPAKVAALVYLAAFLPRTGDSVFSLMEDHRRRAGPAPVEALMRLSPDRRHYTIEREGAGEIFYNRCEGRTRERAVQRLVPQPVLPLSGKLMEEAPAGVPRIYISCLHDRVIPVAQQRRMAARTSCRELLQLDAGHSPFYSDPEQLARILECL